MGQPTPTARPTDAAQRLVELSAGGEESGFKSNVKERGWLNARWMKASYTSSYLESGSEKYATRLTLT